jgi:hypothetical protein
VSSSDSLGIRQSIQFLWHRVLLICASLRLCRYISCREAFSYSLLPSLDSLFLARLLISLLTASTRLRLSSTATVTALLSINLAQIVSKDSLHATSSVVSATVFSLPRSYAFDTLNRIVDTSICQATSTSLFIPPIPLRSSSHPHSDPAHRHPEASPSSSPNP